MKTESLTVGIHRVRCEGVEFNLSIVNLWGVTGVAAFRDGEKQPAKGRHLSLSPFVVDWLARMELLP